MHTVLPGIRNRMELQNILGFLDAAPEERYYSLISTLTPKDMDGMCVYCNHCQPCPCGLDVGLINKYYDLAVQEMNLPLAITNILFCTPTRATDVDTVIVAVPSMWIRWPE